MAGYNKMIAMGNLTRDPKLRTIPGGAQVCDLSLATNRSFNSANGEKREETCFIDCRAYGRTAETLNQYAKKGNPLLVEGRLQYDTWEGKDGVKRSKHRVFVERFQFLGTGRAAAQAPRQAAAPAPAAPAAPAAPSAPAEPAEEFVEPVPPTEEEALP